MQARGHHDQHFHARQRLFARPLRPENHRNVPRQSLLHNALHAWPVPPDGLHVAKDQANPLKSRTMDLHRARAFTFLMVDLFRSDINNDTSLSLSYAEV